MTPIKQLLSRSAVWGTLLHSESFTTAVWRLTIQYTAAVGVVLTFFSIVVFQLFTLTVGRTSLGLIAEEFHGGTLPHEIAEHLFSIIVYTDIGCFILAFFLSYWLARQTLRPLEQSYLLQKQFVTDTAHELRTPLSVMKAGGEVLLRHARPVAEYQAGISSILEETNRLITMTNGLLLLSRPARIIDSDAPIFSFSAVVEVQYQHIVAYASSHQVQCTADIAPDVQMYGRSHEIGQAVLNILKNAIDYNQPSGTVHLRLVTAGTDVILTIQDTGRGISPEQLTHIFERFYKVDTARTGTETSGAGLGLAIVKDIITTHRGTITVTSTMGVGTTFTVTLPRVT